MMLWLSTVMLVHAADKQNLDQKACGVAEHVLQEEEQQRQQQSIAAEPSSLRLLAEQVAMLSEDFDQGQQQQQQQQQFSTALPHTCMSGQEGDASARDGLQSSSAESELAQADSPEIPVSADTAGGSTINFLKQCQHIRKSLQQLCNTAIGRTIIQASSGGSGSSVNPVVEPLSMSSSSSTSRSLSSPTRRTHCSSVAAEAPAAYCG